MNSIYDLLSKLHNVKPAGKDKWVALCPAHDDHQRSLSISHSGDKVLLYCFAGCPLDAVLAQLELQPADLFFHEQAESRLPEQLGEVIATYPYHDANGTLLFEVVRFKPKTFRQRRPDGAGGWIWDLKGIKRVLYRLPEVVKAVGQGSDIFLVEGEKDVEALRGMGLIATTNPMGAGKWRDGYSQTLEDARIVIIPDGDAPGRAHADQVARALHGVANSVKCLELPAPACDVSDWLAKGGSLKELLKLAAACPPYQPSPEPQVQAPDFMKFNLTDLGNAERFVEQHGKNLYHCEDKEQWLLWTKKIWQWDRRVKVMALAKRTARNIYHEAGNEPDDKRRKQLADHAFRSESDAKLTAMLHLAQSELGIPVNPDELDANPWLFNCNNGTLDLRTGELYPHRREDLLTTLVPIDYKPGAECPLWSQFLQTVTNDNQGLIEYLQRAVGYSLTGDTREQCFFFLYGLGNNGKSTFLTTIQKLMAPYTGTASTELFLTRDRGSSGPAEDLANLKGKRLIAATEVEDSRRMAVALVKQMTGGESIRASRKYEHEVEFRPTHKIWIVGNHKPVIADTTLSIWRRVKLIPFTVTIPPEQIDPQLARKLEDELPGILSWAVQGCLEWQKQGLKEAEVVRIATASYRHESDILADFIEDCCVLKSTATISKRELREAYTGWCETNSAQPVSARTFRARLFEKGIGEGVSGKVRYWKGITSPITDATDATDATDFPGSYIREGLQEKVPGKSVPNVASVAKQGSFESTTISKETLSHYEKVLKAPIIKILECWKQEGRPVIHLAAGTNCEALAALLDLEGVKDEHLEGIKKWFEERVTKDIDG